jgi:uncharacterized protein
MSVESITEIKSILVKHTNKLIIYPIEKLQIFGSFSKETHNENSDLDIIVFFKYPVGYFELFELKACLESITGRSVDLVTPTGLHPALRDTILREAKSLWSADAA